jgi:hypothetical protein
MEFSKATQEDWGARRPPSPTQVALSQLLVGDVIRVDSNFDYDQTRGMLYYAAKKLGITISVRNRGDYELVRRVS